MFFCDLALSRRLERAEGHAAARFAQARRRLFPESRADWMECAGAFAVFDGIHSPVTQSFGIGLFEDLTPNSLDTIEHFFQERGTPAIHEVSPLAGVATLDMLCARQYRPIEVSNVLYCAVKKPNREDRENLRARTIDRGEKQIWSGTNGQGSAQEHPELLESILRLGAVVSAGGESRGFSGERERKPGTAAVLHVHEGVALLAGAVTVPELRRRGLQTALLRERMHYAFESGCDLAMMVAEAGGHSQRDAECEGFRVAYTRVKWQSSAGLIAPKTDRGF
jgi:ribosomal protein S18 acetylase RimI-like enzyme